MIKRPGGRIVIRRPDGTVILVSPIGSKPNKNKQMKFIVSSSTLLKQLQHISGVINANTVLPILEDFLFEVGKNKLTVVATDLLRQRIAERSVSLQRSSWIR
jgi:DNA polymerase III beta subunit, N-terminal domain